MRKNEEATDWRAFTQPHSATCDQAGTRNYAVGDCAYLATAIVQVMPEYDFAIFGDDGEQHVAVALGDGRYLDVRGVHTAEDIRDRRGGDGAQITSDIWAEGWDVYLCGCDFRAACEVLDRAGLLAAVGAEIIGDEIEKLED